MSYFAKPIHSVFNLFATSEPPKYSNSPNLLLWFFCLIKSRTNCSGFSQSFLNPNLVFFSNAPQIVCHRINKEIKTEIWRIRIQIFWGSNVTNKLQVTNPLGYPNVETNRKVNISDWSCMTKLQWMKFAYLWISVIYSMMSEGKKNIGGHQE